MNNQIEHFLGQSKKLRLGEKWELAKEIMIQAEKEELSKAQGAKAEELLSHQFELNEAHKAELDERSRLRHEGKLRTYSWEEVKARIRNKS